MTTGCLHRPYALSACPLCLALPVLPDPTPEPPVTAPARTDHLIVGNGDPTRADADEYGEHADLVLAVSLEDLILSPDYAPQVRIVDAYYTPSTPLWLDLAGAERLAATLTELVATARRGMAERAAEDAAQDALMSRVDSLLAGYRARETDQPGTDGA